MQSAGNRDMDAENVRNDDDIAIYIDELKCDDPNLKLNAVTKIVDIARILGRKDLNQRTSQNEGRAGAVFD